MFKNGDIIRLKGCYNTLDLKELNYLKGDLYIFDESDIYNIGVKPSYKCLGYYVFLDCFELVCNKVDCKFIRKLNHV